MSGDLYRDVGSVPGLWDAWKVVRRSGQQSASRETVEEISRFEEHAQRHLNRISRQLREDRFQFDKAIGVPVRRLGKPPRPIIVATVENRIVQRRILDILQRQEDLIEFLVTPTSFGGIRGRGVRHAVSLVLREIQQEKRYFLRSDIVNFFDSIPKAVPLKVLDERLAPSPAFRKLLRDAVHIELQNLAELGQLVDLFPVSDIGVAQGSCLSLLMGNILLNQFDRLLNDRGVICVRYVDDFLLLGPSEGHVLKAFESALRVLKDLGLTAYDPRDRGDKAEVGPVRNGFTFLGCRIIPGLVRPSRRAQKKLLTSVDKILGESRRRLSTAANPHFDRRYSVSNSIHHLANVIHGWREQYAFCNDGVAFEHLDKKVVARVRRYLHTVRQAGARFDDLAQLRALGVSLLVDRTHRPTKSEGALQGAA
jgi:hypothetical protein